MGLGKDSVGMVEPNLLRQPPGGHTRDMSCMNESVFFSLLDSSPAVLYTINTINAIICLVGLTGNILVFYVVCRFSSMHTVTNIFILMLALADIAFLVNIPFLMTTAILENWPFGNIYCKIYYSMTTVNQFASSFFLVTMSADRYIAICLPIRSRGIRTTKSAILVCCIVWALAIMLMYPVFLYAETDSSLDGYVTHCNIFWPDSFNVAGNIAFALYCFVLGYAFPVVFMLTFYGLVVRKLRSRHSAHEQHGTIISPISPSNRRRRSRLRKVTVMIFVVIVVYLLCWTPYWGSQLYITFSPPNQLDHLLTCPITLADIRASQRIVYTSLILQCLCFANSAINPILYAILSENFKKSYSRACDRITESPHTGETTAGRESSCRPDFNSNHRKDAERYTDQQEAAFPNHHQQGHGNRRIYFSCNMHSPSMLTPSANGQLTSFTDVSSQNTTSQAPSDDSQAIPMMQGEVVASFQITAWTPLLSNQEPMLTSKTLLTTFEMGPPSPRKSF